ncbi:peroxidase-like [Melanaphis sacchari]|uniref:Chorion peroxidase n=1 Tax=Melanaphis sacchari TaxID=742174 RepID=A0A2H8TUW2_9HEMI|nr:peroxidase-like [Melanaphis sacchari]XP_025202647.1 peroxidase-like [Melanaphis sacchari]XP_025202648.1 peroxidase-like [Melanaphis sacchari]
MGNILRRNDKPFTNENSPLIIDLKSKSKWCKLRNVTLIVSAILCILIVLCALFTIFNKPTAKIPTLRLNSAATINNDYFDKCAPQITCDAHAKYRTINGSCNNLQNPNWGAALTPFYRYMNPEFSDGISAFRVQSDGSPLPNARNLTLTLFQDMSNSCDDKYNEILVPWGQFIAHDVAYSPVRSVNSSFPVNLSHCDDENSPIECKAAISLSPNDPVYGKYNMTILKFMRLITSEAYNCSLVPDTVLNKNTHFIDSSNVYGSDSEFANELRLFSGGQLVYNTIGKEEYCPQDSSKVFKKGNETNVTIAFVAGDVNVNQNLGIALIQNLFLRFHNYIAKKLQEKHLLWTDETVYQETRRIVIAVTQIITYNNFLPIILGEKYINEYGLNNETNYDPTIIPSTAQEMTSGAYRLLHNIIPAKFNYMSKNYTTYEVEEPSKTFLRPDSLIGNVDGFIRGLAESAGRKPQSSYNSEISNIVIQSQLIDTTGFDLLSYDIQRGRDVGLPPYTKLRSLCGLPQVNLFDDLSDYIPSKKIDQLKDFYSSVDDIDYFVGILLENKMNGSMLGPTGSCIIADSFYRFRNGDRFFYDVKDQPGSFTPDQIQSLKNITISHIICVTSGIKNIQKDAFRFIDHLRLMKLEPNCETYTIDLTAW